MSSAWRQPSILSSETLDWIRKIVLNTLKIICIHRRDVWSFQKQSIGRLMYEWNRAAKSPLTKHLLTKRLSHWKLHPPPLPCGIHRYCQLSSLMVSSFNSECIPASLLRKASAKWEKYCVNVTRNEYKPSFFLDEFQCSPAVKEH